MKAHAGHRARAIACAAVATTAATPVLADTYTVTGDFTTIQAALDACVDGDEVIVADGTWTGSGNRGLDFDGDLITLRSASGNPALCTIDCQRVGRGFIFTQGETADAVVEGFTIANGFAIEGGGFYVDGASPTIRDSIVIDCFADLHGGGASPASRPAWTPVTTPPSRPTSPTSTATAM